jgi:hypothetical protein
MKPQGPLISLRQRYRSRTRVLASDEFHADAISTTGKRSGVGSVAGEDCVAWLGDRHHECLHG